MYVPMYLCYMKMNARNIMSLDSLDLNNCAVNTIPVG